MLVLEHKIYAMQRKLYEVAQVILKKRFCIIGKLIGRSSWYYQEGILTPAGLDMTKGLYK